MKVWLSLVACTRWRSTHSRLSSWVDGEGWHRRYLLYAVGRAWVHWVPTLGRAAVPDAVNKSVARLAGARRQTSPSATAEITCAQRAAETLMPMHSRLIKDPYARYFLRSRALKFWCTIPLAARFALFLCDRLYPGVQALVLLRNLWYEEILTNALQDGFTQVVLLGAGYDTTAHRLDLGSATLFEVDAPPTQEAKREVIRRHGHRPNGKVVYVPCDFEGDALVPCLQDHGFNPSARSLIVWYGVSYYLSAAAVRQTFSAVADLSAVGSRFLWDYMDPSVIDGTTVYVGAQRCRDAVAKHGEPFSFGVNREDAEHLMRTFGFDGLVHMTAVDLAARYGEKRSVWCRTDNFFGLIMGEREVDCR